MRTKMLAQLALLFIIKTVIASSVNISEIKEGNPFPITSGFVVYHNYSNYEAWDANLFLYNFNTNTRVNLSSNWNIDHEMNAHISPDGTMIVFMGDDIGGARDWDIYIWNLASSSDPINLTNKNGKRDEDPKFSPDGTKIIFKQSGDLLEMDLQGNIINFITNDGISNEESMGYYTSSGDRIIYALGAGAGSDIYSININGTDKKVLFNKNGITEYFPIVKDEVSFFYTGWESTSNRNDQIYLGDYVGNSTHLLINDLYSNNSDAYPVYDDYLFFSSTRNGGIGGYDLYIGKLSTGEVWSLFDFGINTNNEDLGACFFDDSTNNGEDLKVNEKGVTKVSIYPNPFLDYLEISAEGLKSYSIYTSSGILFMHETSQSKVIDLSELESGIYFIELNINNKNYIHKIIKN